MTERERLNGTFLTYRIVLWLWIAGAVISLVLGHAIEAVICAGFATVTGSLWEMSARIVGIEHPDLRPEAPMTLGEAERTTRHDDHLL